MKFEIEIPFSVEDKENHFDSNNRLLNYFDDEKLKKCYSSSSVPLKTNFAISVYQAGESNFESTSTHI